MAEYIEQRVESLEKELLVLKTKIQQQEQQQPEKLFTVAQVASLTGLTTGGVNSCIRSGQLIAQGKRCKKITLTELNKFLITRNIPPVQ